MATQAQIEALLKFHGFDGYDNDDAKQEIEDALYEADAKTVEERFIEGSRWSNYKARVHEVISDDGREFFFEEYEEFPATEMQDGGEFTYEFREVYKREKTITVYE